nr:MAG TPA: hypothetical protein [Caudoviricetes sp.]
MCGLDRHAEGITGKRFQNAVLLDTLHGEAANAESHIAAGKAVIHEFLINSLAPLDRDGITVDGFDMRVKHLIALGVDGAAELVPQVVDGLSNDFDRVAGIAADEQSAIMVEDLIMQLGQDVIDQVPVIVGIGHDGETGIGVQLGQQATQHRDFIAIHSEVGTHDAMLGRNRAIGNRLMLGIAVIIFLEVGDGRDCGGIQEGQAPAGAGFDGGLQTFLATEGEIAESFGTGDGIITGKVVIFIHDLAIEETDRGGDHRVPEFGADKRFEELRDPGEVRVGVFHFEEGNMDGAKRPLGQGVDLDGKIAKCVQGVELFFIIVLCAESVIQHMEDGVTGGGTGLAEEILVEILDQIFLTKCLDTEDDNFIYTGQTGHARGEVAGELGSACRELTGVGGFIKIAEKHGVDIHIDIHIVFSLKSMNDLDLIVVAGKDAVCSVDLMDHVGSIKQMATLRIEDRIFAVGDIHADIAGTKFFKFLGGIVHSAAVGTDIIDHKNLHAGRDLTDNIKAKDLAGRPIAVFVAVKDRSTSGDIIGIAFECPSVREVKCVRARLFDGGKDILLEGLTHDIDTVQQGNRDIRMRIKDADLFKIHGVDHLAKIFESENLAVFGAIHTGVGDIRHDKSWLH